MSDPIPYEDNITHTQLWKRIDGNRDTSEQEMGQLNDHWESSVAAIVAKVLNLIKDNEQFMDNMKASFQNDFKQDVLKSVTQTVVDGTAKILSQIATDKKQVNDRLNGLEELIDKKIESDFIKWTIDLSTTVKNMQDEIAQFKQGQNDSLNKSSLSIAAKVSGIDAKLNEVLGKLRGVLKDL